jgi:hypothetical protein
VGYGLGQTDKFQGTGVFNGIKLERNKEGDEKDKEKLPASAPSDSQKKDDE